MPKISAQAALTSPRSDDLIEIVDVHDLSMAPTGTNKRITVAGLRPGNLIYVDDYGADPSGATDSSAAIQAKQTALGAVPYALVFGAGTYLMNSAFLNLGLNQYIVGQGQQLTQFNWSGSGPLVTINDPGAFNSGHLAGRLSGFNISGPFGAGATSGIKYGSLQSLHLDDIGFYGLPSGAIIGYKTGASDWAEEAVMTRLRIIQCGATSGYMIGFTGTSFDYSLINAVAVCDPSVDIVSLGTGAQLQGLDLSLRGNLTGGTSNTGAIVSIDRGNTSGTSYLTNAHFNVSMESNAGAGTVGHYSLWMGSNNAASQFAAEGTFNIKAAGATPQGIRNPGNVPVSFNGLSNDPSGGGMTAGDAVAVTGGTCLTPASAGFGAAGGTVNVYWQFGDVNTQVLANGASTIVFNGANGFVRRGELALKQPASGAIATVTWPGSVIWATGTAPVLSTAFGAIDRFRFTYIPGTTSYYGEQVEGAGTRFSAPWSAADNGYAGWTMDPAAASGTQQLTSGKIYLWAVQVRYAQSVSHIVTAIAGTAAAGVTAGQNFIGLYNSAGTRLASTGIDSAYSGTFTTVSTAITAQQLTPGMYWIGWVMNATTMPSLVRGASVFAGSVNPGLANASLRFASNGTGTSLPATITPASNAADQNAMLAALGA